MNQNINKEIIKRKFKNKITFVFVLLIVLIIGIVFSASVLFKINDFLIEGETRYSKDEIVKASDISFNKNLFILNTSLLEENIKKNLIYIEDVSIEKRVPNGLTFHVTEGKEFATLLFDNKYVIINSKGKILNIVDQKEENTILVKGINLVSADLGEKIVCKDQITITTFYNIIDNLKEFSFDNINLIDISDLGNIIIEYDNRIKVLLGMPERLDYKVKTARQIIFEKIRKEEKGSLNMMLVTENKKSYFKPE